MKATRAAIFALLTATAACAHRAPPPAAPVAALPAPAPADLPLPNAIVGDLTLRQKLTARSEHGGGSFETILQKRDGVLTVVGLTPYGSRAFVLQQKEHDVQFTSYLPRDLPFPPTFMLLDIHRVFDTWLGPAPATDGPRTGTAGGEQIGEQWQAGRLRQRTFTPTNAAAPGAVTITYQGEALPGVAADITLANARFGYDLLIHNVPVTKAAP